MSDYSDVGTEIPEVGGDVSVSARKKMIENDRRNPIFVMRAPRLDAVVGESTGDVRVWNRQSRFRIDLGQSRTGIDFVRSDDAIATKRFCFLKIQRRFPGHPNRADFDGSEEHRRFAATEDCLRIARQQERAQERSSRAERRFRSGVGRRVRGDAGTSAIALLRGESGWRGESDDNQRDERRGGRVWESNPPDTTM